MLKNIFLASAHAEGAPLPELVEEIRSLEHILRPLHERETWGLLSNRAANLDDIFDTFNRSSFEIGIFHYAGHANQQELHIEGGGRSKGIAALFGLTQGKRLRLVFLNGCATLGHVDHLHGAGVAAVIATNQPIGDSLAREFAACFYKTWAMDGNTLEQAFLTATALVNSKTKGANHRIAVEVRNIVIKTAEPDEASPWRLWINHRLSEAEQKDLLDWPLNPPVQLAPQVLAKVETVTSDSLRKVAFEFCQFDPDARKMVEQERCSELMALIIRLPWMIGTHLRRLFAMDKGNTMRQSSVPRLREISSGYTELTRFICYAALSALWEDSLNHQHKVDLPKTRIFQDGTQGVLPDYVFHLKRYHQILLNIPGDTILLEAKIGGFLAELNGRLQTAYQFMEGLKNALGQSDKPEVLDNFILKNGPKDGLDEVCRKAEAAFGQFIKAAFFLTQYCLYSVRAISVDKVRYMNLEAPYVHKTIALHAAFGEPKPIPTSRKIAGDNYSILLAPRTADDGDQLENALNLSPFYIDKHALIGEKRDNYPAIFVLTDKSEVFQEAEMSTEKVYRYEYLDIDINHRYLSPEDHRLNIGSYGLLRQTDKEAPPLKDEDNLRFREIFQQIEKLNQDFRAAL